MPLNPIRQTFINYNRTIAGCSTCRHSSMPHWEHWWLVFGIILAGWYIGEHLYKCCSNGIKRLHWNQLAKHFRMPGWIRKRYHWSNSWGWIDHLGHVLVRRVVRPDWNWGSANNANRTKIEEVPPMQTGLKLRKCRQCKSDRNWGSADNANGCLSWIHDKTFTDRTFSDKWFTKNGSRQMVH